MKRLSICGWCIDGACCQDRPFPSFVCIHTRRCEPMLDPEQAKLRDARVKEKALNHARRLREETKEDEMFMMEALHEGWAQLDREVDAIMEATASGASDSTILPMKARSRGKAEVLVLFMPHPFDTADDIAKEAYLRWQARQNGEVRPTLTMHRTTPKES